MTDAMKWVAISIVGIVAIGFVVVLALSVSRGGDTTADEGVAASTTTTQPRSTTAAAAESVLDCDPEQEKQNYPDLFPADFFEFDSCDELAEFVWEIETKAAVEVWVDTCAVDGAIGLARNESSDVIDITVRARLFDSSNNKLAERDLVVEEIGSGETVEWSVVFDREHPNVEFCNSSLLGVKRG